MMGNQPISQMPLYLDFSNPVDTVDFVDRFITTYKDQTQKVPSEFLVRVYQGLCDGVLIDVPQKNLAHFRSSIEVLNESYAAEGVTLSLDSFHAFLQHLKVSPARVLVPLFKGDHYTPHGVFQDAINAALFPYELASWYETEEQVKSVIGNLTDDEKEDVQFSNEDSKSDDESEYQPYSAFHNSSSHPVYIEDPELPETLPYTPFFGSLEDPYFPPFTPTLTRQNASSFNLE